MRVVAVGIAALLAASPLHHLAAQCGDGSASLKPCSRPLDAAKYLVLPFEHVEGSEHATLSGRDCAELLKNAFGRWIDVRLADSPRLNDALRRRGVEEPYRLPFTTGRDIARQLGAGRVVFGRVWQYSDTTFVSATTYDVASGRPVTREMKTRIAGDVYGIAAFNALADLLVAGELRTGSYGQGAEITHSKAALVAFGGGEAALAMWDLAEATRRFRAAVAVDSAFALAWLRLGDVLLWTGDVSPSTERDRALVARAAPRVVAALGAADRLALLALQAMFEDRWPDACAGYREILRSDSLSFRAWFGLAECNARDPAVIASPVDATRLVFRGSYEAAVEAYRRALLLAPSFNLTFQGRATERLARLLAAEAYVWRKGRRDGDAYFAFPELESDTLAYHPEPGARMALRAARPATHAAALAHNRRILLEVTAAWANAYPREPQAHRALARAFEVNGRIAPLAGTPRSALSEIAVAQGLTAVPAQRRRDAVEAVRLLLKAGDFPAARRAADSLLRGAPAGTAGTAAVAVLVGRPALAARLLAVEDTSGLPGSFDNRSVTFPLKAAQTGLALLAYAAAGAPADSVAAYERRVEDQLNGLPRADRPAARSALLDVPAELVFEGMGPRPAHRPPPACSWLMAMQWALAHGDTGTVRAGLDTLLAQHGEAPPAAEVSTDGVYLGARLLVAVGDTARAARYLDGTLDDLPGVYAALFDYLPLTGALVRMMALRADLAAARGEVAGARRWAGAVVTLWSNAEPALQPTVTRMRRILTRTK